MTFRDVYNEHFAFVWRSLRRLGVAEQDCADAAQEVFSVVYRRLDEFEGRSRITTWLFGICLRVSQSSRRKAARRGEATNEQWDVADPGADVEAQVERKRGMALLEHILSRMSLDKRTVFILFELEGLPLDEIAKLLEIPLGTVQSRLRLARQTFRDAVERADVSSSVHRIVAETST